MSARHEIPTHLDVADRAFAGLTVRQLLVAAAGLALAYGAWRDLPAPIALRVVATALTAVATTALAVWTPGGRPLEEWTFVLARYGCARRVAVWRPQPRRVRHRPREVTTGARAAALRRSEGGTDAG